MPNLNIVPKIWLEERLDNLAKVVDSAHQTPIFSNAGFPMVRVGDIKGGKISLANTVTVNDEVFSIFTKNYKPQFDDILMTRVGSYGRSSIVKTHKTFCLGQNTVVINPQIIVADYLYQYLQAENIQAQIDDTVSGSSQKSLSLSAIKALRISSPHPPEQQKIAAILTSVDEVIEKTQAQIDKLKDLKSGMMQELLTKGVGIKQGDKYAPHTEFKDSPVGKIPKSWKVVSLENLVKDDKKITYGIVQAGPHHEGGIPYIRVSDMNSRYLTKKGMLLTSPEIAKKFERSAVSAGDIVYALRGMIGHVHIIPNELDGANLTQGTARISPSTNIDTGFLLWSMRSPYVAEQNDLEAKGSTFKEVTLASLRKIQIAVPLDNEQKFISAALTSVESRIFATEDKLEQTKNLKKALMQDLLTGKVRVKVDNDSVV
ncbi:MAG: restriction endonuclease subunit S [Shewanella oncorhynchi]